MLEVVTQAAKGAAGVMGSEAWDPGELGISLGSFLLST